ncbi:MAG: GreA/GreB family elongation factor [Clostridia bacterium]|nr:GreA/GreB family elongation factor [Clostridia bacterium]
MHDELTKIDIKKMQEEIEDRKMRLTPILKQNLKEAREQGDLSENDEYKTAKRELNMNYSRIRYLQAMIDTAIIVDLKEDNEGVVGLFDKVKLFLEDEDEEEEIVLVTTLRQDAVRGFVSKESPLGMAVMGKKVGDRVKVKTHTGYEYFAVIKEITKGEDDESLNISRF